MAKLTKEQQRFAATALKYCVVHLVVFSALQYISFLITRVEQEVLIQWTFTLFGVEIGGLLLKRILEKLFGKKKEEDDV